MSTHFSGEGNIGSAPEFHEYPNGNEEPRRVLRLNVYSPNDSAYQIRQSNTVVRNPYSL
ncbi:hypothetical protein [Dickeya dadantii]|uniref:hypothetical protein n=1 Tax=Dickeya dadantii TaxID=204038 RepID=UPI00403D545D